MQLICAKTIPMQCSITISLLLALVSQTIASSNTTSSSFNEQQVLGATQANVSARAVNASRLQTSARSGRMLDLAKLAGEVDEAAKSKVAATSRQSRQFRQDETEGRSRKGSAKKMSINGFIPIVSLSDVGQLTGGQGDENEQGEEQASNLREQLAANYGGQTSIGHASIPASSSSQELQWHQAAAAQNQVAPELGQESGRAQRKLFPGGHLLSNLVSAPNRLNSNYLAQNQFIGGPMNQLASGSTLMEQQTFVPPPPPPPPASHLVQPTQMDCVCVPFYQCKNGYLAETALSKSSQLLLGGLPSVSSVLGGNHNQVPRSLAANLDQNSHQMAQMSQLKSLPSSLQANQQQQQYVNDIYEQLRKNIESANLEQQAAALIDGRQANSNNNNQTSGETQERSLITRRQSGHSGLQRCGIMRTCCRPPPRLSRQQGQFALQQRPPQQALVGASHVRPQFTPFNSYATQQQTIPPPMTTTNPLSDFYPNQAQAAGYNSDSFNQLGQSQNQLQLARPPPPPPPPTQQTGSFMSGRCGLRQALGISGRVQNFQGQAQGESGAEFGEFPAHAAILKRISPGDSLFVCSAVLVSQQWLATAAHCVRRHQPEELKIRLGEWDVQRDDELYPHFESNVREIVLHPDFQPSSLMNDLALIRLEQPVSEPGQMPHVAPACLGQPDELPAFLGQRCWVAGWGKDAFGQSGSFQSSLRRVDLPLVGHDECEHALRSNTKLGRHFRLHQGNICAGGEQGKDACEGDGGGGLYCVEPHSGLVKAVGLVSWGVGCGQRGVPGVFVSMAHYGRWIEGKVAASGEPDVYADARSESQAVGQVGELSNRFSSIISERTNTDNHLNGTATSATISQETEARNGLQSSSQSSSQSNSTETGTNSNN